MVAVVGRRSDRRGKPNCYIDRSARAGQWPMPRRAANLSLCLTPPASRRRCGLEKPRGRNEMPVDPIPAWSAAEIIRLLDLQPHPEGGFFRETFRDPARDARGRAVSTLIYYLLDAGQVSRWHKVDATEVWHFYAGAP